MHWYFLSSIIALAAQEFSTSADKRLHTTCVVHSNSVLWEITSGEKKHSTWKLIHVRSPLHSTALIGCTLFTQAREMHHTYGQHSRARSTRDVSKHLNLEQCSIPAPLPHPPPFSNPTPRHRTVLLLQKCWQGGESFWQMPPLPRWEWNSLGAERIARQWSVSRGLATICWRQVMVLGIRETLSAPPKNTQTPLSI